MSKITIARRAATASRCFRFALFDFLFCENFASGWLVGAGSASRKLRPSLHPRKAGNPLASTKRQLAIRGHHSPNRRVARAAEGGLAQAAMLEHFLVSPNR